MLTELQVAYLKKSWKCFWDSLRPEQQRDLHFRLDDLMQYGMNALPTVYWHLNTEKLNKK